jgi:hypothetical protein
MRADKRMTKKHFRALVYSCYLAYIKSKHPQVNIKAICDNLAVPYDYLRNPMNWLSVEFDSRFTQELIQQTNDKDLSYNSALLQYARENFGPVLYKVVKFAANLDYIYKIVPKANLFFNNVLTLSLDEEMFTKGTKIFNIIPRYEKLGNNYREIDFLQSNINNIYQNTIGHICSITSVRFGHSDFITQHTILKQSVERCSFSVYVGDVLLEVDKKNKSEILS